MNLIRIAAFAATIMLAPTTASATDPSDLVGLGTANCVEFGRDFRHNPSFTEGAYSDWLFGFLTGANATAISAGHLSRNIASRSVRELRGWMRDYCDNHPLGDYIDGAIELYKSLPLMPDDDKADAKN